jgi:DNA polymerase III epsilon subunit-like protein
MFRERDMCRAGASPDRAAEMHLIFDTETAGLPLYRNAPGTDTRAWPRLVQIAWLLCDEGGKTVRRECFVIRPDGFAIPPDVVKVHGITTSAALRSGVPSGLRSTCSGRMRHGAALSWRITWRSTAG